MPTSGRPRPVILTVDDDAEVLRAIARDLRTRYAERYRIIAAGSPEEALRTVTQLRERLQPVALLLVDQRMPGMTGIELLEHVRPLVPDAKRVLLTAYADTSAAIDAINRVGLHHYLLKPWHPPEQQLYPVLDDVLDDWAGAARPGQGGILLVDHHWSPRGHALRDFLTRNQIPYRRLDLDRDPEAQALGAGAALPLVVLEDGTRIPDPDPHALAERLGMTTRPAREFYDLLIVGAGPAGLAAAVYGASEGLKVAVVEHEAPGGQAGTSSRIENYLGFPAGLSGADLARRALAQARRFGAEMLLSNAEAVRIDGPYRFVRLSDGTEVSCHALLVASGVTYRAHEARGVQELTGVGVYYGAALTEAIEYRDADVFVVGAGNSAGQGALFLAQTSRSVTLLCRGDSIAASMSHYLVERLEQTPNVTLRTRMVLDAAHGDHRLEAVTLRDVRTGTAERLRADAVFIYIGAVPCTDWLGGCVVRDARGFVLTGRDLPPSAERPTPWPLVREPFLTETSLPGVFAAGDVRCGSVKRVASAVGEGSITVQFVHQHLAQL
ncbi:MAG: FAD-dependent oxidoreductase [bacterium]|nr:FAD-dependent oxidoreductase [bacterium]